MGERLSRGARVTGRGALAREEIAKLRTIGEVAEHLDLPQHVLRFWETRFKEIDPVKRAGGRRFYRARDIALVEAIRHLLYSEGYTIKGVQRILKEQGVETVVAEAGRRQSGDPAQAHEPPPLQSAPDPLGRTPPAAALERQPRLDLPEPEPRVLQPAPSGLAPVAPLPAPAPIVTAPIDSEPPQAEAAATFHAPVVVTRRLDSDQAQRLREVLAEIEECKRLLNLTRR
jgi:DNA-binding transcriptional MerR regulator